MSRPTNAIRWKVVLAVCLTVSAASAAPQAQVKPGPGQTSLVPRSAKEFPVLRGMPSTRAAIEDLIATYGGKYAKGQEFLGRLTELEKAIQEAETALAGGNQAAKQRIARDGRQVRRLAARGLVGQSALGLRQTLADQARVPGTWACRQNWQANCSIGRRGYDNQIAVLSPVGPQGKLTTLMKPKNDEFVGDLKLDFDADKMLFSMPDKRDRWQVWEIKADGSGLRQVTPGDENDVDNFDPCYLPDGRILFTSSRAFHGVPCVGGGDNVANLCIMNADGTGIRQLCFDQDQNWCPTVLNDGRVLYTRWEYSDMPHYFTRLLFQMNPDGSGQMAHYKSNSYWPNSTFYAKPIPGHPTKLIAVISGHHGVAADGRIGLVRPGARGVSRPTGRCSASRATARRSSLSLPTAWSTAHGPSSSIPIRSATNTSWFPASPRRNRSGAFTWSMFSTT